MGSRKKTTVGGIIRGTFANIGRVFAALIMVGIITGCIVASVLTVYILRYINSDEQIRLDNITMKYTTIIYADNSETGEPYELQRLQTAENRVWVDFDKIPEHMVKALICVEDKRFMEHQGVDWKRTFGAFVNLFVPIYDTQAGGSTITQQLIKNITGDDDLRIERKVQEIFRALNLEKNYSKEQILEAYLNTVFFSNSAYGVQAAANTYFGKDVSELTLAESASIIGITNYPGAYNPFVYPEKNKKRQEQILFEMLDQGVIDQKTYDDAVAEELHFEKEAAYEQISLVQSDFIDHVIEEVISDLMEEKQYTYQFASQMLYSGGYRIYTTVDEKMQTYLSNFYSDVNNFPKVSNEDYPQSACVITDPNGKILAVAGGIGEKEYNRALNRATQSYRQCGSSIKPIGAYLQAIENDVVTWSTKLDDSPIVLNGNPWPVNHYRSYLGMITIDEALQRSTNTIPVKLVELLTPRRVFDFLHDKLAMDGLVERKAINGRIFSDIDIFPMALGGLTEGVTPLQMAGGYQIYANGGYFTEPYSYTKVLDSNGEVVLEKDIVPRRVISAETATIINRLMQRVTTGPAGTGGASKFSAMPVAGKTGTTDDDFDQWFIGVTPYYVCSIWMGYDTPETIYYRYLPYPPPVLFRSVMGPLHEGLEVKDFPVWGDVVQESYCVETGDLAGEGCPTTAVGWYKTTYKPPVCNHSDISKDLDDEDEEDMPDDKENTSSKKSISKSSSSKKSSRNDGLIIIENED